MAADKVKLPLHTVVRNILMLAMGCQPFKPYYPEETLKVPKIGRQKKRKTLFYWIKLEMSFRFRFDFFRSRSDLV